MEDCFAFVCLLVCFLVSYFLEEKMNELQLIKDSSELSLKTRQLIVF